MIERLRVVGSRVGGKADREEGCRPVTLNFKRRHSSTERTLCSIWEYQARTACLPPPRP